MQSPSRCWTNARTTTSSARSTTSTSSKSVHELPFVYTTTSSRVPVGNVLNHHSVRMESSAPQPPEPMTATASTEGHDRVRIVGLDAATTPSGSAQDAVQAPTGVGALVTATREADP